MVWLNDSRFAAFNLGRIKSGFAAGNGGTPYGFAAVRVNSIVYRSDTLRLKLSRPHLSAAPNGPIPIDEDLTLHVL